jgi:hypothetical protein
VGRDIGDAVYWVVYFFFAGGGFDLIVTVSTSNSCKKENIAEAKSKASFSIARVIVIPAIV